MMAQKISTSTVSVLVPALLLLGFFIQTASSQELTPAKKTAVAWIDKSKPTYEAVARYLWDNPELSLVEFKSAAKLQDYLEKNGFKIEKGVAGMPTAFVASWGTGKPVIGILDEFDALPALSQTAGKAVKEVPLQGAPGHGCGHNLYGPTGVTAAIAAKIAMEKHQIKGTVKLFGCPAEETCVGKVFMARDGVFDHTDVMISYHPWDYNGVESSSWLAATSVKFQFKGRSAHAALAPFAGRSALDATELFNIGMNYMREHVIQEARIHYVITNGGQAPNVVPADAEVWYFIRSPRRTQVDEIWKWMVDVAKGASMMTQTSMDYRMLASSWEVLVNRALMKVGEANIKAIGTAKITAEEQKFGHEIQKSLGKEVQGPAFDTTITSADPTKVFPKVNVVAASTDEGNVNWIVPTVSFRSAISARGTPLHTWQNVSQTAMAPAMKSGLAASKWMAATALDCLADSTIVTDAWKEHNTYLADTKYYHTIPADMKLPTFKELYGIEPDAVPGMKK
ncbi:MAG: amidohydrolase [Chitinivibrionales bacterium]|nr:amidohydrolase [Chitinivibrionales bacterium]